MLQAVRGSTVELCVVLMDVMIGGKPLYRDD